MKSTEYFILKKLEDGYKLNLLNSWNKETIPTIIEEIKSLKFHPNKKMYIDFQDLKELDSIAIIYLISFFKKFRIKNISYLNLEKDIK
ncbi:MAG: hypothetical protein QMB77_07480 [Aliarcobacter cryaerophilus]